MVRMVYQNPQRWLPWVVGLFLAICLVGTYAMREAGRHAWLSQLSWTYFALMGAAWARKPLYILTDDLLVIRGLIRAEQRISLSAAGVQRVGRGWLVSWKDGKLPRGHEIRVPEPFAQALQAAIAAAKAAGPRTPGVVRFSAHALPRWSTWAFGGAIVLLLLAIAINQPRLLAPFYALGVWSTTWNRSYLLVGDQLLIVVNGRVAATIPLAQVQLQSETTLLTSHPQYPRLHLPKKASTSLEFVRDLRAIQSGTLAPYGQAVPQPGTTLDGPRCTLCGAHLGEAPAAHAADVVICPACTDRARYEAVQSGHGLITAKGRPPM